MLDDDAIVDNRNVCKISDLKSPPSIVKNCVENNNVEESDDNDTNVPSCDESMVRHMVVSVNNERLCSSLGIALNNTATNANKKPKDNQSNVTKTTTNNTLTSDLHSYVTMKDKACPNRNMQQAKEEESSSMSSNSLKNLL